MSPLRRSVRSANVDRLRPHLPTGFGQPDAAGAGSAIPSPSVHPPSVHPAAELGQSTDSSIRHILVVDDEPDIRKVLRALLEEEGYVVTDAVDGVTGLALLRASSRPLVVLVDYKMPRLNGEEMLQAVAAEPHLANRHAFIFVTANLPVFSPELRQLLTSAAIPVVEKPFSFTALLEAIERSAARLQSPPHDSTS